ncbi:ABC transporter permease subunit, partial [Rhizobium ruizarguesonis]
IHLAWFPVGVWGDGSIKYLILPIVVLALPHAGLISRITRGSMIEVMNQNFIRTAKATGISAGFSAWRMTVSRGPMPL